MRLYLVRHGQTAWNLEGRAQGHTDIPLDAEGQRQAEALAVGFVYDFPIKAVYSSDLIRCIQTAEPLAKRLGVPLIVEHALREQSFGELEGLHFTKVRAALDKARLETGEQHVRPPGGESLVDVWNRVRPFALSLTHSNEPTIVVAHGGSTGVLLSNLLAGTVDTARGFRFGNTGVSEVERRYDGTFVLSRYNDTSHLALEAKAC